MGHLSKNSKYKKKIIIFKLIFKTKSTPLSPLQLGQCYK